ncbi:MAG: hypothetical protein ABIB61_00145 [Candidatus Shapirobacteria bacterium]
MENKKRHLAKIAVFLFSVPLFLLFLNFFIIYQAGLLVSWQKRANFSEDSWSFSPSFAFSSSQSLLAAEQEKKDSDYLRASIMVDDARPLTIKNYLEHYHSPLLPYVDLIFQESLEAGINPYLVVAIAQQESNLCKKTPPDCFNCWGIGIHSRGTLCFDSYEVGIKKAISYFKEEYVDLGMDTPEEMMVKYCPLSDGSWAIGVNQFLEELSQGFGSSN